MSVASGFLQSAAAAKIRMIMHRAKTAPLRPPIHLDVRGSRRRRRNVHFVEVDGRDRAAGDALFPHMHDMEREKPKVA